MEQVYSLPLSELAVSDFHRNGFILLPGIFSVNDMQAARETFLKAFSERLYESAPYSNETIINDIYSWFPELISVLLTPAFVNAIRSILGDDFVWMPECSIHRNRYIHWHKDTSYQESHGEHSHIGSESPLIQAAIYFQENGPQGGGLTVLPGTHTDPDKYSKMYRTALHWRAWYWLLKRIKLSAFDHADRHPDKVDIPTDISDLLLFDLRLDHCSTPAAKTPQPTKDKLAIFNTFARKDEASRQYFEFMKNRTEPYYRYYREYPLPQAVYDHAASLGVTIWY